MNEVKVRGGDIRKIVEFEPSEVKDGDIIFDKDTGHAYVYIDGVKKKILLEGDV